MINKTKSNNSFFVIMFIIMAFIITLTSGCGAKTNEQEPNTEKPNTVTNEDVVGDKQVDVFKLTKTSLVYENGSSTLITSVYNSSSEKQYIKSFNIELKDDSNKVITTLIGYIGEEIAAGETRQITSSTDLDLTNASKIEYTINK